MTLNYDDCYAFLTENVITPFYEKRQASLEKLTLDHVLQRKNPYLFKAKYVELAQDLVRGIVDAHLSSQEETVFGNLLEGFAVYVSGRLYGGFKSKLKSVDLEFERDDRYYVVGIKSGIYWGNSDQINRMKDNFKKARAILRAQGIEREIIAVNGCIYGKDRNPLKDTRYVRGEGRVSEDPEKVYYKYAGQDFWHFVSGDDDLYREIIKPIDEQAKVRSETFAAEYSAKINIMTAEFTERFTDAGAINWVRLIDYVSRRARKDEILPEPEELSPDELETLECE